MVRRYFPIRDNLSWYAEIAASQYGTPIFPRTWQYAEITAYTNTSTFGKYSIKTNPEGNSRPLIIFSTFDAKIGSRTSGILLTQHMKNILQMALVDCAVGYLNY